MNLDDLEKQWEDGDDLEELKTEQQAKFERLEKRRKEAEASAGTFDPRQAHSMCCQPKACTRDPSSVSQK